MKKLKNPKAFIYYSQTVDDVYENLEEYGPTKKRRVLIVFDDMIADMESNIKISPTVTGLLLRGRKLTCFHIFIFVFMFLYFLYTCFYISLVFISHSYFKGPDTIRLNATHYVIMKIPNKREL